MTHQHPEWKRLYAEAGELIAGGKTEFSYDELTAISGIDVRTPKGRGQFIRFQRECLTKLSLWLENERGKGYRVIKACEHVNSAAQRVNRARRMTGRALAIATNTRFDQLNDAEKSAALSAQAAIGTLYLASKEAVQATRRIAGAVEHPKLAAVVSAVIV